MKYAIRYSKDFRHFDTVDEVIFSVHKGDESIVTFIPTVVKEDWQKATLDVTDYTLQTGKNLEDIIPFILKLKEIHSNILVQIQYPFKDEEVNLLKDNNIPFMAAYGWCKSLDMVYTMKEYGVSEVYVAEGLGFNLSAVKSVLSGTKIEIRVIPNVTQCALGCRHKVPTISKFWIRPEDTVFYNPYVNTFELFNEDDKLSVVYEVYKQERWKGNIRNIILDADDLDVSSAALPPYFGSSRLDCKQKCLYGVYGKCEVCKASFEFARTFEKTEEEIIYPKKEFKKVEKEYDKTESNEESV